MGHIIPVFLAILVSIFDIHIFRQAPEEMVGPLVASYIFLFSVLLLLLDIQMAPESFVMMGRVICFFMEFWIIAFVCEFIMVDFWFPLLKTLTDLPSRIADNLEEWMSAGSWNCDAICERLRSEAPRLAISYILALLSLIAVLHATRAIDLRELEYGIKPFFADIICRIKLSIHNVKKAIGLGKKKRVHIKAVRSKSKKKCGGGRRKSNPCRLGSEDYYDYDYGDEPMDKDNYDDDSDFDLSLDD